MACASTDPCCDIAKWAGSTSTYRAGVLRLLCKIAGVTVGTTTQTLRSGTNNNIPAGLKAVAIEKTNDTGSLSITTFDGTFTLSELGEALSVQASENSNTTKYVLPAFTLETEDGAEWRWFGVQ